MEEIKIDRLVRSRRRTISLEINSDGSLIVRAPKNASNKVIQEIVYKKRNWIRDKVTYIKNKNGNVYRKAFVSGEEFLYLGNPYKLLVDDETDIPLTLNGSHFILSGKHIEDAKELFIAWYKEKAYEKFSERALWYSSISGLKYNLIKITNARKRWGSCGVKGNLNFSWWLAMAPLEVIDYVVVHELAHIKEKNHKRRFWNKVRELFPEYEKYKHWLKENDHLLII